MSKSLNKNVRRLVTLPPELVERVEKYRQTSAAASESEALKALIEDGLKFHDRRGDLFERFESAIQNGQSIGDIINLLAADHPLVSSTYLNHDTLVIYLKIEPEQAEERFVFNRLEKKWDWERHLEGYGGDDAWESIKPGPPPRIRRKPADLDDEIPF